jgi:sialic acid synthase SpsE
VTELICECATGHGGDLDIAADMVRAAADSGATYVKFQTYDLTKLNPQDPQAAWLKQAHLDRADHEFLIKLCGQVGIQFLSTPFCADSLAMLRDLGLTTFKVASSESGNGWFDMRVGEHWIRSWPWGIAPRGMAGTTSLGTLTHEGYVKHTHLAAIPLYPTPLEAVGRATLLDGWSDHCEGIAACQWALAQGATVIEAHLTLPGKSRQMPWDKTPEQFRQLRDFADKCETMRSGVSTQFRRRWSA